MQIVLQSAFRAAACAALACAAALPPAAAQSYPRAPVTLVVPLAAGDASDTAGRAMADELARQLGVVVIVTNRPGASGAIGVQSVMSARKDGYTLLFTQNSPLTIRRALDPQATSYDPLKDLTPLGLSTRTPSVLVVPRSAPFNSFAGLIAQAKKTPGGVKLGNAGPGSAGDVSVQLINSLTGSDITSVPYKGAAPAVTDALGSQIDGVIVALGAVSAHIKSGALKAIAISSRSPEFPDVPTLGRLGFRQEILGLWMAFFAPVGVAAEVTQALIAALEQAASNPAVAARLLPLGIVQEWTPAAGLSAEIEREYETVGRLAKRMQPAKP